MRRFFKHTAVVFFSLFLLLGVPTLRYVDIGAVFSGETVDAVSHATTELPEQPSGEFVVLLNTARFSDTSEQWQVFFAGGDAGVIMSDICCMVIDADITGQQLAERYQARLPENQMEVRRENGLLLASKAEYGLFDVIVVSQEMAEVYNLQTVYDDETVLHIAVKGE